MKKQMVFAGVCVVLLLTGCGGDSTDDPAGPGGPGGSGMTKAALGKMLYEDTNLSKNGNQSCESCHSLTLLTVGSSPAARGFADPDSTSTAPVTEGSEAGEFGDRNAPTAAYAMFAPDFQYDTSDPDPSKHRYIGGQFLDGRAVDLEEQAKGPFLNPKEMAMADKAAVIAAVRAASYAAGFKSVYGATSLDNVDTAYDLVADAIAVFERRAMFAPFSSKFDAVQAGKANFTDAEQRGFDLFKLDNMGASKGKCAECHKLEKIGGSSGVLFTDFSYWNIGVPKNPNHPLGTAFVDIGLAANPNLVASAPASGERGKFKVPTLRNVELTAPYMHNGSLATLEQVVNFYNERDPKNCFGSAVPFVDCWPDPEVADNLDDTFSGDLSLSAEEEADLVAFMKTLTDGYFVP